MNLPQRYKAEARYNKRPILVIMPSRIGDAVLCSGILDYVRAERPHTKVIIAAPALVAPLFLDYPNLDHVYLFEKEPRHKHWLKLWQRYRKTDFEWVIDCRGSVSSYLLSARKRFIWSQKKFKAGHKVEQISRMMGKKILPPMLWISPERVKAVNEAFSNTSKPYICIAPAANWQGKQWPIDYWKTLLEAFQKQKPDHHVFALSAAHERDIVQPLVDAFPDTLTLVAEEAYSLLDSAALIKEAACFIGNDSGLMHMAVAVKTPTIGLFGPSREWIYGPYGVDRNNTPHTVLRIDSSYEELIETPDFSLSHPTANYMETLKPERVMETLLKSIA